MRLAPFVTLLALAACTDAPVQEQRATHDRPAASQPAIASDAGAAVGPRIQGVTLDARHAPPRTWLPEIAALGATHVTVIPFAFQRSTDDAALGTNYEARWYTEGRDGIGALARQADSLGLHVVIKPQIWIRGAWSADIAFETEADWATWEAGYRAFALYYARLSAEINAPLFVIGTELAQAVRAREAFWRSLIAEIRTVYDGDLTYAANWHDDAEHVAFWDALDYVGVQAYFPLSDADAPDLATLRAGWQPHEAVLEALHARTSKPILFTEIGYRDIDYAAARPWEWPSAASAALPDWMLRKQDENRALQARLYAAFFEEVWPEPWFAGAILWKFHPSWDQERVGAFSPQGKPAESVIRTHYGTPPAGTGRTATPDLPPDAP